MSDKISELPDSLLRHILSFLPTKQAIATSRLSKRWKPLWRGLSTFDVDDVGFKSFHSLAQFVDALLILRDFTPLKKFRIYCKQNYTFLLPHYVVAKQITIWFYKLKNIKVEKLELFFPDTFQAFSLPTNIFVCSTIQELRLSQVAVPNLSHVNLPSLKLMSLSKVRFPDFKCVATLLSGCPLLEKLVLSDLDIRNNNISTALNVRSLQHLASAYFPALMMTMKAFSTVKILRLSQNIWSPSLDTPTYPNLTHMEFSMYAEDWGRIMRCFHNCPKLQIFSILQVFSKGENNWTEPILDVPNCISSHLKTFCLANYHANYQGWDPQFQMARFIMKEAKVLNTISIRCIPFLTLERKHQMLKRLSNCPRSSWNCELNFV